MQISGVSLALTWPHRLCLLRVLLCKPLLQAFPFPSTLGEVTLHLLSQACVFIYSSHGKWAFPPLLWSFPPTATFTTFPAPGCWACAAAPTLSSQARLIYLQFCEGFPSPTSVLSAPHGLCYCLYCSCYLLLSFSFFPWVGVGLSRGLCWSGPGLSVEVPRATYLTLWSARLPKMSGHCHLEVGWGPSWFLCLVWSGDVLCRLEVWRRQSFASSWWFCL
jgi:hypothetical protein